MGVHIDYLITYTMIHTAGTAILTTELEILTMFGSDHRGVDINWCSSFQSVLDGRLNQIWH